MFALVTRVLLALRSVFEGGAAREAEILVLRQRLLVWAASLESGTACGESIGWFWSGCTICSPRCWMPLLLSSRRPCCTGIDEAAARRKSGCH